VKLRHQIPFDFCLLFLLATAFLAPYYTHKYTDQWPSIESTFISQARFLTAHWPHPQWQPLWYTGTRFDYIYPPAVVYGTALLSKVFGWWPVKAYHFYTIFFYCVGIAGVYLLVRVAGRSRGAGYLAALAAGLMSPSLLFMKNMRLDSGPWMPVRFGALVRYGEGPHITALSLLPIALAFTWRALEARRPRSLALAAIFCGAVVSNNFYGATSLALFFPLLLWSFWITRGQRHMALPALAIPMLAYGLTAFWLTPSYLRITMHNMRYVSDKGNSWSIWAALAAVAAFGFASYKLAANAASQTEPRPSGSGCPGPGADGTWAVFVAGSVVVFGLNVLGNYYLNFRVLGEPGRLVPELDLVLILAIVLVLEWLWRHRGPWPKLAAAVVVIAAFATTRHYIKHARDIVQPWPDYQARVEYRVTDWLWKNMPEARAVPSGTVRFWFDTWHDLAQLGGGSEQGLLNPIGPNASAEIMVGSNPEVAFLWLKAMGVDAMYLAHKNSQEPYKDGLHPERFFTLPVLFDDGLGNTLYGAGRRYPARVRVVETARLAATFAPRSNDDLESLRAYVGTIENGPDSPATLQRQGSDAMVLHARLDAGQSLLVQETWDPAWQASTGGQPLPVRPDAMGFMVVDPPPGDRTVQLEFVMPLENRVGWGVTALSLLVLAGLVIRRER
jgi:hypothetical protein